MKSRQAVFVIYKTWYYQILTSLRFLLKSTYLTEKVLKNSLGLLFRNAGHYPRTNIEVSSRCAQNLQGACVDTPNFPQVVV